MVLLLLLLLPANPKQSSTAANTNEESPVVSRYFEIMGYQYVQYNFHCTILSLVYYSFFFFRRLRCRPFDPSFIRSFDFFYFFRSFVSVTSFFNPPPPPPPPPGETAPRPDLVVFFFFFFLVFCFGLFLFLTPPPPPPRAFSNGTAAFFWFFEIYHVTLLSSSSSYNRAKLRWMKKTVQWMKQIPAYTPALWINGFMGGVGGEGETESHHLFIISFSWMVGGIATHLSFPFLSNL
jgi:hypothetical protein